MACLLVAPLLLDIVRLGRPGERLLHDASDEHGFVEVAFFQATIRSQLPSLIVPCTYGAPKTRSQHSCLVHFIAAKLTSLRAAARAPASVCRPQPH